MLCIEVTLVLLAGMLAVQGRRISEIKCSEYRNLTIHHSSGIALTLDPNPIFFETKKCNQSAELIVGGEDAKAAEFPHQALLGYRDNETNVLAFKCGGTLISERYVLTAAHCSILGKPELVRFAELDLTDNTDNQVDLEIEKFIQYGKYRPRNKKYYDIALIRLKENVMFSDYIRPACLWTGFDLNVTKFIATGFGNLQYAGESSDILQKVQLDILDPAECNESLIYPYGDFKGVVESQLCVGSIREGKDTCQGDSGGPLQVVTAPNECIYHVVGITSFGSVCGTGRSPSVYTRVSSYIDWIEDIVWGNTTVM